MSKVPTLDVPPKRLSHDERIRSVKEPPDGRQSYQIHRRRDGLPITWIRVKDGRVFTEAEVEKKLGIKT